MGVSEALDLAMRAILNPGDEVIMPDPHYVAYDACVILAGGEPVMVPTYQENNFEVDADDIEARITEKTKAILIGYPANPTGAVMEREKLLEIAEVAQRHHLMVISDEIYARLVYGVEHTCFASLPGMKENTILLGGFSKAYAMTGWRIGYAAAPREIIAAMTKIHQYTIMCAPTMAQVAAIEALKTGEPDVVEMVEDYNRRRKVIVKGLCDIGLPCFEPQGRFLCLPVNKQHRHDLGGVLREAAQGGKGGGGARLGLRAVRGGLRALLLRHLSGGYRGSAKAHGAVCEEV